MHPWLLLEDFRMSFRYIVAPFQCFQLIWSLQIYLLFFRPHRQGKHKQSFAGICEPITIVNEHITERLVKSKETPTVCKILVDGLMWRRWEAAVESQCRTHSQPPGHHSCAREEWSQGFCWCAASWGKRQGISTEPSSPAYLCSCEASVGPGTSASVCFLNQSLWDPEKLLVQVWGEASQHVAQHLETASHDGHHCVCIARQTAISMCVLPRLAL